MKRRGFLAGLLALPFVPALVRAAQVVKRKLTHRTIFVGAGAGQAPNVMATLSEAMDAIEPGGTIYLLPGHTETINEPLTVTDVTYVGMGRMGERPKFTWKANS